MQINIINSAANGGLSFEDRGLAYGDGHFTTAIINQGKITLLAQHLQRLVHANAMLMLPAIDIALLEKALLKVANSVSCAVLKVIITAGAGGRGYSRQGANNANVIISLSEYPGHYRQWQNSGLNVGISEQHMGISPMLSGIKHLNRLEQVLLRTELDQRQEDELLVTNISQNIVECCSANVFWRQNGQWYTPTLEQSGVAGIMRAHVLAQANIIEINSKLDEINSVDAMFITNAVIGIAPVKIFNGYALDLAPVIAIQEKIGMKIND